MRTRCDTMSRPAPFRVSEAAALRVSRLSYTLRRVWPQTYVRHLHAREIPSRACGASTKTRLSRKPAVPRCLDRADDKRAPFSRRSRRFIKLRRPSGERAGFLKYEKPPCELDQASANSGVAGAGEPLSGCVAPMLIGSASKSPIAGRGPSISEAAEQDLANEHILAIDPHAENAASKSYHSRTEENPRFSKSRPP